MQDQVLTLTFQHEETAAAFCRGVENMVPVECIKRSGTKVVLGMIAAEDVAIVRRQWAIDNWPAVVKIEVKSVWEGFLIYEVVVQYEPASNAGPNSLDSIRVQIDAKDNQAAEDAARKLIRRRYGLEIKNVSVVESSWIKVC